MTAGRVVHDRGGRPRAGGLTGEDTMAHVGADERTSQAASQNRPIAAENGRSMEEEARNIQRRAVGEAPPSADLGRAIHARSGARVAH